MAQGGLPGSRLTKHLGIKISRQTLLRLVMKTTLPSLSVPKVLGIDDWAYRKHHTYGTILVDLETHQPIDLLSDRTASTLAEWLEKNPGVEIISRDRALAYKEGASKGCPQAIQVADRFHLLQNLTEMLEIVLNQHRTLLKNVEDSTNNYPIVEGEEIIAKPVAPPSSPKKEELLLESWELVKVRYFVICAAPVFPNEKDVVIKEEVWFLPTKNIF